METEISTADKLLLEGIRDGHSAAFEQLFNQYWQELYLLAYHRLRDQAEAEDMVQDIFTGIWERRDSLEIHTSFKYYLRTALKYRIIKWVGRAGLHQQAVDHLFNRMEEMEHTILDVMAADDLKQTIGQAIAGFPENMRRIFTLRTEDYTISEIAEAMGLAEQTVKNNTTEALRRLKAVLTEKHPDVTRSFFTVLLLLMKN